MYDLVMVFEHIRYGVADRVSDDLPDLDPWLDEPEFG